MEIKLWKDFRKRRNSTKQPPDSGYITKQVVLKGNCSITSPEFFLADADLYSYLEWNGLYYFITDVSWDINNASYVRCQLDYLASWKAEILNTTAFVKYSSTDYSLLINDNRVLGIADETVTVLNEQSPFSDNGYTYILTTIGEDGGIVNWYLSWNELVDIYQALMDKTNDWIGSIFTNLTDALSSIISLREVPLTDLSYGQSRHVYLGTLDLELGYDCKTLTDVRPGYETDSILFDITRVYSDFRMTSKYTSFSLYLPMVGSVELSADDLLGAENVVIKYVLNAMTGNILYRVGDDRGHILGVYSGSFGRHIPISNIQLRNTSKVIGDVASGAVIGASILGLGTGGLALGGGLGAAALASAISNGVNGFTHVNQRTNSLIGGYDGSYGEHLDNQIRLTIREQKTRIEPSNLTEIAGNPCCKVRPINGLTGYVETIGFSISLHSTDNVRETINRLMDSGVYIE